MKIAITGHTVGIGKAIADACEAESHEVVGFSRTTGYTLFNDIDKVVADSENCDVFVNNRYDYYNAEQVELLYRMFESWRGQDKRIVNISSRAGTYSNRGIPDRYAIHKQALDAACDQLNGVRDMRPRVTNLKPGYVDTPGQKGHFEPKLSPEKIAEIFMWILNQPRMVHISSVSMTHIKFG